MPRAVLQKGVIYPVEPLPSDWRDGMEVNIERIPENYSAPTADEWMDEVEALAAQLPPEVDEQLATSIARLRQEAKELARRGKR